MEGNIIGLTAAGNDALGNGASGIFLSNAPSNIIGGLVTADANFISGNNNDGVLISGDSASLNTVEGDYFGLEADLTTEEDNLGDGVHIVNGSGNVIGGTVEGAANYISYNQDAGVDVVGADASMNKIEGNFIGVAPDGKTETDNEWGVYVGASAQGTIIGEAGDNSGNVIAGSTEGAIVLTGTSSGAKVANNLLGITPTHHALDNSAGGVLISQSSGNTIGGTTAGQGNYITLTQVAAGNGDGIEISGNKSTGNMVQNNTLIANYGDGVAIDTGASGNTIGGASAGLGNLIAQNVNGVDINGAAYGNTVQFNNIGTDINGQADSDMGNDMNGVLISRASTTTIADNKIMDNQQTGVQVVWPTAMQNTLVRNTIENNQSEGVFVAARAQVTMIGDGQAGDGNTISNNTDAGISIYAGVSTEVVGNTITSNGNAQGATGTNGGLDDAGFSESTTILDNTITGNTGYGIDVSGDNDEVIGDGQEGDGNTISNNTSGGIFVLSSPDTKIIGNNIGTDADGNFTPGDGNEGFGISVANPCPKLTIEDNFVTDNIGGILLTTLDSATTVQGNFITHNLGDGVDIAYSEDVQIGDTGDGEDNVISNNRGWGIELGTTVGVDIIGNYIGTDDGGSYEPGFGNGKDGIDLAVSDYDEIQDNTITGNNGSGVHVEVNSSNNTIGGTYSDDGNTISNNTGAGVAVDSGTDNAIQRNAIFNNGALGIDLAPRA